MQSSWGAGAGNSAGAGHRRELNASPRSHTSGGTKKSAPIESGQYALIESLPLPVVLLSSEGGIRFCNSQGSDLLATLGGNTTPRTFTELLEPDSGRSCANVLQQIQHGILRSATLELRFVGPAQPPVRMQMHISPVPGSDPVLFLAMPAYSPNNGTRACRFPGLTGCLADSLHPWMCILTGDLRVDYSNSSVERVAGVLPVEIMRDPALFASLLTPENLDRLRSAVHSVIEGNAAKQLILPFIQKDGQVRSLLCFLTPLFSGAHKAERVMALFSDLASGPATGKAVAPGAESILEQLPMGYVALDGAGRIVRTNHHLLSLLQISREELLGRYFGDYLEKGDQREFIRNFGTWLNEGSIRNVVLTLQRADGATVTMKVEGRVTEDSPGGQPQLHCVMMGISSPAHDTDGSSARAAGGPSRLLDLPDRLAGLDGRIGIMCDSYVMRAGLQRIMERAGATPRFAGLETQQAMELSGSNPRIVIAAFTSVGDAELARIRELIELFRELPLLIVCITISRPLEQEIIKLGVRGLITSENEFSILPTAVRSILDGELWCPRSIMQQVLEQYRGQGGRPLEGVEADTPLTRREIEVLRLVAKAYKNKEIAQKLGVGYNTIVTHVYNIFRKINVRSRLEAMNYALSRNLL